MRIQIQVKVRTDFNYAKHPSIRKSVTRFSVPEWCTSFIQKFNPKHGEPILNESQAKCCSDECAGYAICLKYFTITWFEVEITYVGLYQ